MVPSATSDIPTSTDSSDTPTIDATTTDDGNSPTDSPTLTTTDEPTTTTTTDESTFSPNSVYQYETLAWLSEPFSYNAHTHKKTKTAKPTSTATSSHNDSNQSSDSGNYSGNNNSSHDDDDGSDDDDDDDDDDDNDSSGNDDDDDDDSENSSKSFGSSHNVKTTENDSQKHTNSHPEYITPNINAIIPETSSIAYLRFHTLSYSRLVSDSLLTAQFVQELPAMISQALNISTDDVIFLTITSEKNDDNIKSLFKRGKKKGLITALAIPTTEMNALSQLIQSKDSSLYLPVNEQIVSMLDRSYPIGGMYYF
jgi:hypothetical protein